MPVSRKRTLCAAHLLRNASSSETLNLATHHSAILKQAGYTIEQSTTRTVDGAFSSRVSVRPFAPRRPDRPDRGI